MIDHTSTVLVTGATGSFGSAFCAHLLRVAKVRAVRGMARGWHRLDTLERHLDDARFTGILGDVTDPQRMREALRGHVDVIVHAAAIKDVGWCEFNPGEAQRVNVGGTQTVVREAVAAGVRRVILLSTDKAVNPANVYGASKLAAESLVTAGNAQTAATRTRLAAVRYGNVLGSAGSVLVRWREALAAGMPLTVRDPDATRFWVTLEDAVQFVVASVLLMHGGEVFVPVLRSSTIDALRLALAPDAPVVQTGALLAGEKRHECLISAAEARRAVAMAGRYVICPSRRTWEAEDVGGKRFPDGWEYTSETATRIPMEELRALLGGVA